MSLNGLCVNRLRGKSNPIVETVQEDAVHISGHGAVVTLRCDEPQAAKAILSYLMALRKPHPKKAKRGE